MTAANGSEAKGPSLFWLVYGQIAAMLGAFSLLVFASHFVDVGLRGFIRDAYESWVIYVRPLAGYPLQLLVGLLPPGWRFEVPIIAMDYFAVGAVAALSMLRASTTRHGGPPLRSWPHVFGVLGFVLVAWPWVLFLLATRPLRSWWSDPDFAIVTALWLAPLIYLALLFAANAWLV